MIAPDLRGRSNTTGGWALGRALSRRRAQQTGGDSRSLGHCGRSRVHSDEETRNMNRDPTRTGSIQSQQRLISTGSLIDDVVAERPTEASSRKKFPGRRNVAPGDDESNACFGNQSAGPSLDLFTRQNRPRTGHPILSTAPCLYRSPIWLLNFLHPYVVSLSPFSFTSLSRPG